MHCIFKAQGLQGGRQSLPLSKVGQASPDEKKAAISAVPIQKPSLHTGPLTDAEIDRCGDCLPHNLHLCYSISRHQPKPEFP